MSEKISPEEKKITVFVCCQSVVHRISGFHSFIRINHFQYSFERKLCQLAGLHDHFITNNSSHLV